MDQTELAASNELHQYVVEASQEPDTFKLATIHLFDNLIVNDGYGDGIYEKKSDGKKPSHYEMACHHLIGNIDMIYDYAESPIERLFLCSLLTAAMCYSPFMITITKPIVADVFPTKITTLHQRFQEIKRDARKQKYPDLTQVYNIMKAHEELEPSAYAIIPKHLDAIGRELTHNLEYLTHGLGHSFHVSLQPTFEQLRVEGKAIRPDMMLWVPTRSDFKLIVECDGYQYHSDKEMFSKDRLRDRVLQQQGYQVFRFSGHEIMQNATLKVNEFLDYLYNLAEQFDLDMEQAQREMNTFGTKLDAEEQEDDSPKQPKRKKKKPSFQQKRQLRQARRRRR